MGFYNLNPDAIRDLQAPDPGDLLKRDGSNLASVLANLGSRKTDVEEYLAAITPGVTGVDSRTMGTKLTLDFRQEERGAKHPWRFLASNMSDGTLRALGVLVALFQGNGETMGRRHLVGIEEPESALHPAAAGVPGRQPNRRQPIGPGRWLPVTARTCSTTMPYPDSSILAVLSEHAQTRIGPHDETGRSALRDHLFTAGELLRMDQLHPDPERSAPRQLDLFANARPGPRPVRKTQFPRWSKF